MKEATIQARGLTKFYSQGERRIEAVSGIDLELHRGEFVALVGPSGAGKSTVLDILGLLTPPSRGELEILGSDVRSLSDEELSILRKGGIGYVFEDFSLIPSLNCIENVILPRLFLKNVGMRARGREILDRLGMELRTQHLPRELSGGELQRTALARALINEPRIVLADEPTAHLDLRNAKTIWDLLLGMSREEGITVVAATHDIGLARLADRVLLMEEGTIVEETTGTSFAFREGEGHPGPRAVEPLDRPAWKDEVVASGVAVSKDFVRGSEIVHALSEVDFEVRRGEIVAVTGPSGSGKSTLLHLVGGLVELQGGTICVEGEEIPKRNKHGSMHFKRSQIGFLMQTPQLVPSLNVCENILLPTFFSGSLITDERLDDLLRRLDLHHLGEIKVCQLSAGEKQRVALGRALIHQPSLILADEPTGRLDSKSRRDVLWLLEELSHDGYSFLIATHSPQVAAGAHRIYHLVDGRVQATA